MSTDADEKIRAWAGWCIDQHLVLATREVAPNDGPLRQLGEVVLTDVAGKVEESAICRWKGAQHARKTFVRRVRGALHGDQHRRRTGRHVDLPQFEPVEFGTVVRHEDRLAIIERLGIEEGALVLDEDTDEVSLADDEQANKDFYARAFKEWAAGNISGDAEDIEQDEQDNREPEPLPAAP